MFNSVQYIRDVCQQRKIPISKLEKECGFSNGYLNPRKISTIPYERAKIIATFLDIGIETIMNGPNEKKAPTPQGERKISDDDIKFALFGGEGEITDAMYDEVRSFAALVKLREEQKKKKE